MANALYTSVKKLLLDGDIDLLTDDIRVILLTSDYTFDAAHDFLDDVAAGSRVAVSGALASKTTTGGAFDAADVTFASVAAGSTCVSYLLYKHTGTEGTSPLLCFIDTGLTPGSIVTDGSNITLEFPAAGIFTL